MCADESVDPWARWLLEQCDGGSAAHRAGIDAALHPVREQVLAGVAPLRGATLLDVGSGTGLIALEAARRVGPEGRVLFLDVSPGLLAHCESVARSEGLLDRCEFLETSADALDAIPSMSVDAITSRGVLAYVPDRARTFAEFYRVLRAQGRVSLFEPLPALMFPEPEGTLCGYAMTRNPALAARVAERLYEHCGAAHEAMFGYGPGDLERLAADAGFASVNGRYEIEMPGAELYMRDLEGVLGSAFPLGVTLREAIDAALTKAEAEALLDELARAVERDECRPWRSALMFLVTRKTL